MQRLSNKYSNGDMDSLFNSMNILFVPVGEDLLRLQLSHPIFDADEPLSAEFVISVTDTEVAFEKVKDNKAISPNNTPPWILKDVTHILQAPATVIL